MHIDRRLRRGERPERALELLAARRQRYAPELLQVLRSLQFERALSAVRTIRAEELTEGMLLEEDVRTRAGVLLVARGHEVSAAILEHLRRISERGDLKEPFRVRMQLDQPKRVGKSYARA